jgi:hypothetical protein
LVLVGGIRRVVLRVGFNVEKAPYGLCPTEFFKFFGAFKGRHVNTDADSLRLLLNFV